MRVRPIRSQVRLSRTRKSFSRAAAQRFSLELSKALGTAQFNRPAVDLSRPAMHAFRIILRFTWLKFVSPNLDESLINFSTIGADAGLSKPLFGNIWAPHADEVMAALLTFIFA